MNTGKVGYLLLISMKIRNWKYWTSHTIKRDVHILAMLQFCKYELFVRDKRHIYQGSLVYIWQI